MGDIILAGSTSGSITVAPPAVAGSGTLTLPTGTDTLVGLAATQTLTNKTLTAPALGTPASGNLANCTGVVITGAAFSAHKNGSNQSIATATWTLVTFGTEEFDVNSNFASNRFTPTISGKYILSAQLTWTATTAGYGHFINLYKNGAEYKRGYNVSNGGDAASPELSIVVDANGTSDYFEIYAFQATGGSVSIDGAARATFFTGGRTF